MGFGLLDVRGAQARFLSAMMSHPQRVSTISVSKEAMKFSAAHFTIFSATERERLHGHNFRVSAELTLPVSDNGMGLSYRWLKDAIGSLCDEIDEYTLLPGRSPYLSISEDKTCYIATFGNEKLPFLKSDTLLLPVQNTTVEELSNYLLKRLHEVKEIANANPARLKVGVSSGDGQWGYSEWSA